MRIETLAEGVECYLGDCRDVMPLIGKVDAVITDPPYGIEFRSNYRLVRHNAITSDDQEWPLRLAVDIEASHSSYIFCRWDNLSSVPKPRSLVTWVKNNWSMGDLSHEHARQTEVCLFYPGPLHYFPNGRPQDVVNVARSGNNYHPTEKPIDLMRWVIRNTSGVVFDPFMGSGTTGVAAVKLGRKFIGIEIEEHYFSIACKRIDAALKQPDLFIEKPKPAIQEIMEL